MEIDYSVRASCTVKFDLFKYVMWYVEQTKFPQKTVFNSFRPGDLGENYKRGLQVQFRQ